MGKEFEKKFDKCPCCGKKGRFFESLANELKERGLARKEWTFCLDVKSNVVIDQQSAHLIPKGAELPAYQFQTDICLNCGCVYAKRIARITAKEAPQIILPTHPFDKPKGKG